MSDKPFEICKECGCPEIDGKLAVVLYFRDEEQREEFMEAAREVLPGASTYKVDRP